MCYVRDDEYIDDDGGGTRTHKFSRKLFMCGRKGLAVSNWQQYTSTCHTFLPILHITINIHRHIFATTKIIKSKRGRQQLCEIVFSRDNEMKALYIKIEFKYLIAFGYK